MNYTSLITVALSENFSRFVVAGIIIRDNNVLLIRRKKDDFMGGIFEFPSGKVEDGENLESALYREVIEETGLKVKEIKKYVGHFDYLSRSNKRTRQFNFIIEVEEPLNVILTEHDEFKWLSISEAKEEVTGELKEILFLL